MSFLTWAALAVGLLVVVPLVAHLLRRRPPDEVPFAATRLVPETTAVAQRRTAIEDRALFAVRALSVIALAVLGATPFVSCSRLSIARDSGASVALAIVLDDSLSMSARLPGGDRTRFERAVSGALELVDSLHQGDAVALVLAGRPARVILGASTNLEAVSGALARVEPSHRGTDLEGAVRVAGELLSGLQHGDKRIVVLSDLADAQRADASAIAAASGIALWAPLEELRGELADCAVIHADRSGVRVNARIVCAAKGAEGRTIAVRAGGEVLAEAPLPAGDGARAVSLVLADDAVEKHATTQLWVELGGEDDLPQNDAAPVVAAGAQLTVAVVSDPASDRVATGGPPVVEQAFRALDLGIQLRPLAVVPDRREELEGVSLLIIDDVAGFTPAERRELAAWVEGGGVMLLTLGPRAAAAPLGSGFTPLLPALVRWKRTTAKGLDRAEDTFFGEAFEGLEALSPRSRSEVELERSDAPWRVLARWDDGAPFLVENHLGRGIVYGVTLPFSTQESDISLRPGFLALLERTVASARAITGVARTTVGSSWSLAGFREASARMLGRDDGSREVAIDQQEGVRRVVSALVGLYELTLDGSPTHRVAAASEDEVTAVLRPLEASADPAKLGGVDAHVDVSPQVALALLVLLFAELAVRAAGRLGSKLRSRSS